MAMMMLHRYSNIFDTNINLLAVTSFLFRVGLLAFYPNAKKKSSFSIPMAETRRILLRRTWMNSTFEKEIPEFNYFNTTPSMSTVSS